MDCEAVKNYRTPAQRIAAAGGQTQLIRGCEAILKPVLNDPNSYRYTSGHIFASTDKELNITVRSTQQLTLSVVAFKAPITARPKPDRQRGSGGAFPSAGLALRGTTYLNYEISLPLLLGFSSLQRPPRSSQGWLPNPLGRKSNSDALRLKNDALRAQHINPNETF